GRVNPAAMPWGSTAAVALAAEGRTAEANALLGEELARARAWGAQRIVATTLRESAALLARSPARLEHVRSLTELGAALRRANQRSAAREPLRAALAEA